MVFWKTYPILNLIKSKCNKEIFKDLQFEKEDVFTYKANILDTKEIKDIKQIKQFLKTNFGGPNRLVLDIPENKICGKKDILIHVKNKEIIGCIRYHYIGSFLDKEMYCVDCFCIHPSWRKKGLGDFLLTKLHIYVNENKIPYSMFLKEGPQLSILVKPLYSGIYVYRKIQNNTNNIISLTVEEAYKLIDIFCEFNPIFIIKNNSEQYWRLYKNGIHTVLACIQDTYQYIYGKKIGWITGWIESPISDEYRAEASKQISDSMYGIFDYIWGNKKWIGNSTEWKIDGQFHWYSYQWNTSININTSYCILN